MKKSYVIIVVLLLVVFIVGIMYLLRGSGTAPTGQQTNTTTSPAPSPTPALVANEKIIVEKKTDPKLGSYLTDNRGLTLYTYSGDKDNQSTCYGECLKNVSPLTWSGTPDLKTLTDPVHKLLNYSNRTDGSVQVGLGNKPLYLFKGDTAPGMATGISDKWMLASVGN